MFSLIMLDFNMPELNGLGVVKELSAMCIKRKFAMPEVVMVSSFITPADKEELISFGVKHFVAKPIPS